MKSPPPADKGFSFSVDPVTGEGEAAYSFSPEEQERDVTFDELLKKMVPEVPCEILEVVEVRAWGDPDHPFKYVKTKVRRTAAAFEENAKRLLEHVRSREPFQRDLTKKASRDRTFVACPADLQIGKAREKGGGSQQTFERSMDYIGLVQDRIDELRAASKGCSDFLMVGMGDTTESVAGHYPNQPFIVDLNESEQIEVATEIHDRWVSAWSQLPGIEQLSAITINSNHDRPRQGGEYHTDRADSRAFTIWRSLGRAYAQNPDRYGHVEWALPEDPLTAVLERHGVRLAFNHGDLAKGSSVVEEKQWKWWMGQTMGGHYNPAAHADVLVTAHYHHHFVRRQCGKILLGCPSSDNGSQWWSDASGMWSRPGLLTFVVDESGVSDVQVLYTD